MKNRALLFGILSLSLTLAGCDSSPEANANTKDENTTQVDNSTQNTSQGETETNNSGSTLDTETLPHEHIWGTPTYSWSDDYARCTAVRVCSEDSTHRETETKESSYSIVTTAGCENEGSGRYIVSFENSAFTSQTHDITLPAIGHEYVFSSFVWTGFKAKAKYVCSNDSNHEKLYEAEISSVITVPASCLEDGLKTYTATYDGHTDSKTEVIFATGHDWGKPSYEWSEDFSTCTATRSCLNGCGQKQEEIASSVYDVECYPTEEESGLGRYTASFVNEAFVTQFEHITLNPLEPSVYNGRYPIISDDGKTVTYGLYPQTHITDAELISELNEIENAEENGWYKYEKEYYVKYVAHANSLDSSNKYLFDDRTYIEPGETYWFKCEPITWYVLNNTASEYTLLSNFVLDKSNFDSAPTFLDGDFCELAFGLNDKYLLDTTLSNSTTGVRAKVFSPQVGDVIELDKSIKIGIASEYARSTGLVLQNSHGGYSDSNPVSYYAKTYYWSRNPDSSTKARAITTEGEYYVTYKTNTYGVRPMIRIDTDLNKEISYGEVPEFSEDRQYVKYGLYPNSHVYDEAIIEELDKIETPEENGWYKYQDEYYAKVESATVTYANSYFSSGAQLISEKSYWFKCKPILWKVVGQNDNQYTLLSNSLIDAQIYSSYTENRTIEGETILPNNYFYSDMRHFLNNDFYQQAFGFDSSYIISTAFDNCNDKVFLQDYYLYNNHEEYRKADYTDWSIVMAGSSDAVAYFSRTISYTDYLFGLDRDDGLYEKYLRPYHKHFVRPSITIQIA